ncbi:MAG: glycosyltransferase family 4 protein [Clostridia bacterium]|nr:glycosyltransferase family 4 protein [Clostridia bacterium]
MKKILILANNDMGLYKFRRELIENLSKEHQVYVSVPKGDYSEELEKMGCKLHFLDMERRGVNPIKELSLIKYYKKLIKAVSPDIVFTYTIKPNIYGGIACRKRKVPYASNITGLGTAIENGGFFSKILFRLYRIGIKNASVVFFQNSYNKKLFEDKKIVTKKSVLLPGSGVNLESNPFEEYPSDDEKIVLLFVGRLMKDKGVEELIKSAKNLKSKYENLHFKLVGPLEEEYSTELEKLKPEKYVELCGMQKDVHRFMKEAHAIVVPSYHEGMSNVCLEAAACGRPLLASRIPGCIKTFDEGISGLGFEPRDTESLQEVIEKFISIPKEKRAEMGRAGRLKMENEFSRETIINKYMEIVENL